MIWVLGLGVFATFALWGFLYEKIWNHGLYATISFAESSAYEGEQAQMIEVIENQKRVPIPLLEASFHVPKALRFSDMENTNISDYTYKRDIFAVLGQQRIKRHLNVDCTKRGYYHVNEMELSTRSLFYRNSYSIKQPADSSFFVYARRTDVSRLLQSCEKMMGAQQCARRLYEDLFAFSSIRDYTITDPMKTINWKASAKTGNLMVNTYDSTQSQQLMIYLDLEDSGVIRQEHAWEESIRVAASVAQRLIHRGVEVGIAANVVPSDMDESQRETYLFLAPDTGTHHLTKIEQMLARRMEQDSVCAYACVLQEKVKDASPLFISKNLSRSQKVIEQSIGTQEEGIWVIPMTEEEGDLPKTIRNLHVYRKEVEV